MAKKKKVDSRKKTTRSTTASTTAGKKRGRKKVRSGGITEKFNANKHVKLTTLQKELKISYQSVFNKRKVLKIKFIKVKEGDSHPVVVTKKDADLIRKKTATRKVSPGRVSLSLVEKNNKCSRIKMMRILNDLKISPKKQRREIDNRVIQTIPKSAVSRIVKALKAA